MKKSVVFVILFFAAFSTQALETLTLSCSDENSTFQMYKGEGYIVATYKNEKSGLQRELMCDGSEDDQTYRCSNGEIIASVWPSVAARGSVATVDVVNIDGFLGNLTCKEKK
jgi:hypothetical protein